MIYGDQVKENERGVACGMRERDRESAFRVWWVKHKERDHLKELIIDEIILKFILNR